MTDAVPFDLDALEFEEEHAPPWTFTYKGQPFALTAGARADWKSIVKLDSGRLEEAFEELLEGDGWERFKVLDLSAKRLGALIQEYLKAQGVKPGESQASTDS
jgi:hypothetical protein